MYNNLNTFDLDTAGGVMNFNAAANAYINDNEEFIIEIMDGSGRDAFQDAALAHYHNDDGDELSGDHAEQIKWIAGCYYDEWMEVA